MFESLWYFFPDFLNNTEPIYIKYILYIKEEEKDMKKVSLNKLRIVKKLLKIKSQCLW